DTSLSVRMDHLNAENCASTTSNLSESDALLDGFHKKNVEKVELILHENKTNPSSTFRQTVTKCIIECADGGQQKADLLLLLAKYPFGTSPPYDFSSSIPDSRWPFAVEAVNRFNGDLSIWDVMITLGWDPRSPIRNLGDATLHYAVSKGHLPLVDWLLDHGCHIDENAGCQWRSTLAAAVYTGSRPLIERLIVAGVQIQNARALEFAASQGKVDPIALLLSYGADINEIAAEKSFWVEGWGQVYGYGNALQCAAEKGHLNVVQFLVEHGADADLGDTKGRTALELAIAGDHLDVVEYLRSLRVRAPKES
ncbi:hypothetical protein H0H93_010757, partial [Arthromyces matolae]